DGETVTKTFNTFVLKGAFDIRAKLISPTEMSQWPEELNGENVDWANLTTQQQALMDEFNTAQQAYEPTRFAVNMDTDNDDVNDSVSGVVFKWDDTALKTQLAALDLPENIIPAYQVGINLYNPNCTSTNYEECNTEIYNTWWNNKAIKATSFKLPIPLKDSGLDGRYNIGVNVVFLDKNTGREVGQGGHTWAEFKVGSADVLVGDEQIVMNGSVSSENVDANLSALNLKVALMSEECTFNETTFVHTCTRAKIGSEVAVVDGNFSLSIAAKTIKDSMDSKGYINLIAFDDRNSDGEFTDWNSTVGANNDDAEMAFWPHNTNVNFENWGEFRVGVSVCPEMTADSTTDMSYECTYNSKRIIPSTDVSYVGDIVIDGIDFKIWGYFSDEDLAGTVPSTEPTQEN
ncbi:MAG: hypothetical protein OQJ77_04710, partial [Thiovulaceae bacterium]|nr:hypothetical protein [Sulfurimonadaceae bacterium]